VQPGTTSAGGGDESISYFQQPFPPLTSLSMITKKRRLHILAQWLTISQT
jgi:hypothetical protein